MDYFEKIQTAVDYIEENLTEDISLFDVAEKSFLSPYHFHRIFQAATGGSVMEYIRKRRLSWASIDLVETKKRIIDISIEYGFESQEAFTRAFKKLFEITPARYRKNGQKPFVFAKKRLTEDMLKHLKGGITMEPKFVTKESFKVTGMECKTNLKDNKIPALWQKFIPRMGEIKNRVNTGVAYGICEGKPDFNPKNFTEETEFTELVCVEVSNTDSVPKGMVTRTVPAQKYAVFTHKGELSNLRITYDYIYGTWLSSSGCELTGTDDFEYYDERFNPLDQKNSEFDIYIPVR